QIPALVDRDLDKFADLGVEHRTSAPGLGCMEVGGGQDSLTLGGTGCREKHDPAEDFDLNAGDDAAVEAAVSIFEGVAEACRVLIAVGAGRERYCDLVALAAVAHESRAGFGQRLVASAAADDGFGFGAHCGEERIGGGRVELVEALQ